MMAWAKNNGDAGVNTLFSMGKQLGYANSQFALEFSMHGLFVYFFPDGFFWEAASAYHLISYKQWHHWAVTMDDQGQGRLYQDGALYIPSSKNAVQTSSSPADTSCETSSTEAPLTIGGRNCFLDMWQADNDCVHNWKGYIASVRIWNDRALSATEIAYWKTLDQP